MRLAISLAWTAALCTVALFACSTTSNPVGTKGDTDADTDTDTVDPIALVCLDPGHPVSEGQFLYVAIINRKVGYYLEDLLAAAGYAAVFTAEDITRDQIFAPGFDNDGAYEQSLLVAKSNTERAAACNAASADYLISIQHNSVANPDPNYTRVMFGQTEAMEPRFAAADTWAEAARDALIEVMQTTHGDFGGDRALLPAPLTMLQDTAMIGISSWASFFSNPEERARLDDNAYLEGEAQALFDAFIAFAGGD